MSDPLVTNVTGLLDVDAIVKTLLKAKQQRVQKLAQERGQIQTKSAHLNNILSTLRELDTALNNLNIDSLFKGKKVTLSDSSVLSATAGDMTPNISLQLRVNSLAQPEIRVTSGGLQNLSESLPSTELTLRYRKSENETETVSISFTGGTLSDLVRTINESQNLIKASIYFDGSRYRLLLAEKDVGMSSVEENVIDLELGGLSHFFSNQSEPTTILLQSARNSRIQLGEAGNPIISPTNTFKDVLPGLQITVQKESINPVTITISDSFDRIGGAINELLNRINNTLSLLGELTKRGAPFQGDAGLNSLKGLIFNALKPLQRLGLISTDQNGKYTLNTSQLNSLIETRKLEEIRSALIETSRELETYIGGIMNSIRHQVNANNRKIQRIDIQLENLHKNLTKEEEKLRLTFTKIETALYRNENLRSRLESFVVSLTENKK